MLDIQDIRPDRGPCIAMPLWTVTGRRAPAHPGFIRDLRVTVAAPSRRAALGVVWRDDPFWESCEAIVVEQHPDEMGEAQTCGRFESDLFAWRYDGRLG